MPFFCKLISIFSAPLAYMSDLSVKEIFHFYSLSLHICFLLSEDLSFIMHVRISLPTTIPPLSLYASFSESLTASWLNHSFSFTCSNHTGPLRCVLHGCLSSDLEAMSFYLSLIIQEKQSVGAKHEEMALNYRLQPEWFIQTRNTAAKSIASIGYPM